MQKTHSKHKSWIADKKRTQKRNKYNRKWKIQIFWNVTMSQIVNGFTFKRTVMLGLLYSESFKTSIYLPAYTSQKN